MRVSLERSGFKIEVVCVLNCTNTPDTMNE